MTAGDGPFYTDIGLSGFHFPQGLFEDIVDAGNAQWGKENFEPMDRPVMWKRISPGVWQVQATNDVGI